jgi:protein dpy-30
MAAKAAALVAGAPDAAALPTRAYLERSVVPLLVEGLAALARDRPAEPVEYLAAFLLKNKDRVAPEPGSA